jgi:Purine-cytosine permease and related proteins
MFKSKFKHSTSPGDVDFASTHVSQSHKRGFWSMFVLMMGFTFFSASMWAGGALGKGLSFQNFLLAVLAGNLVLGLYTALLAHIASKTSLSVHLLSRYSFGVHGSYIPSAVLAVTQVGWFGVGVAMFAIPTARALMSMEAMHGAWLLAGPGFMIGGAEMPMRLLWALTIASGIIMTSSAYVGIKALTIISFIAVPAIAVFGGYSAWRALYVDVPISGQFTTGVQAVLEHAPAPVGDPVDGVAMSVLAAVSIAIGSFISGGTCTPDFARFAKSAKIAVWTTAIAFFVGNSLMFFFGAIGAMVWDTADISLVLQHQGLLFLAVFVLGFNIWTTNDNALYTSGLGVSNITTLPKKTAVLVNGAIGTLAALWLYDNFVTWLQFLNTIIPPIGAILITDYFVTRKGSYQHISTRQFQSFNLPAVIAWAAGSFVALLGSDIGKDLFNLHSEFLAKGLPAINGIETAIVVYVVLEMFMRKDKEETRR